MADIEMKYQIGKNPDTGKPYGEVPYPTGPMKKGVAKTFHWRTPSGVAPDDPNGIVKKGENGRLQMVAPGDNNATLTGVLEGLTLSGSGQTSFNWGFGKGYGNIPMEPDTDYNGTITADADCAGCTLKMTAK